MRRNPKWNPDTKKATYPFNMPISELREDSYDEFLNRNNNMSGIVCKENLEFMRTLQSESIDLIYCDILYGTGINFGDYQDLKAERTIIDAFYLPRIKEMRRILKPTGSIYLQMDTRINHWLRCIMDEVFGYDNFKNEICWGYRTGGMKKTEYPKKHDVILFYTKSKQYTFKLTRTHKTYVDKSKGYNPYLEYHKDEIGEYTFGYNTDIFVLDNYNHKKQKHYNGQKPEELLKIIIETSSNDGDTIADFFLGSGTTAVTSKKMNRNFIGCDMNPKAIQITNERLNCILY